MSAPTPAPGDDRPREGYYPDPSIPGYVRYWNGAAWVPGTSRPAPSDGEPLAPPPGAGPAPAPVEETGPHFFDEDPVAGPGPAQAQHGTRPEPASAWGADRSRQTGFGGEQDRRVSWGAPQGADPRDPRTAAPADGTAPRTDGTATIPPAEPAGDAQGAASGNTFVFRRPTPGPAGTNPSGQAAPGVPSPAGPAADEGTMTFRAVSPRTGQQDGASGARPGRTAPSTGGQGTAGAAGSGGGSAGAGAGTGGFGAPAGAGAGAGAAGAAGGAGAGGFGGASGAGAAGFGASPAAGAPGAPQGVNSGSTAPSSAPQGPGFSAGKAAAERAAAAQAQAAQAAVPTVPQQSSGPQPSATPASAMPSSAMPASAAAPVTSGPGGGQSSWAQQVHRLAGAPGEDQPVAPWKPPVEDVFQAAARRQAAARPAGLGKRLAARLLDTVVVVGVTAVAAVPLGTKAIDHVTEKIDAAKLSGETVTVWLLDGTTSAYLGIVLAVLLLFGALYEALPTAKWGRTLGKKLLGLEVRDIEAHEPPSFGGALRRWLVYSIPGLLVIGVVGVLWCLFDKPWRQCWHDKAARTFVAG
ncbi:RDD family protein [Streptomyces sp. NPDC050803]|uniref:RDD family protein n=1 Tax=unclassified Streptomyces TaxID=2593676 RepID=UPI0034422565